MTQVTSSIHIRLQEALAPLFRVIKNRILSDEEKSILERALSIPSPQEQNLSAERLQAKLQDQSNSLYALSFELSNLKQGLERGEYTDHNKKYLNVRTKFPQQIAERLFPLTISVVDIGGQNLVSEDHVYAPLVKLGVARVTAFEPLKAEANLRRQVESQTKILDYFIGSGSPGRFYLTFFNPASSLFAPNLSFLSQFDSLATMCTPVSSEEVITTRLDDLSEIDKCDFLKIDVQGGELDVLLGAKRILADTIVVHTEVEFAPVYENQPLFADIDQALREQGFELIDLQNRGYNSYSALKYPLSKSRLLWADAVYFKNPEYFTKQDPDRLLHAAFIAHSNYGMYDLAAHCLANYDAKRGTKTAAEYNQAVLSMASSSATQLRIQNESPC